MTSVTVCDFQGFQKEVPFCDGACACDLVDLLKGEYPMDSTELYRFQRPIHGDNPVTGLAENNRVAMLNSKLIREKSYPKVDGALRFFGSRFQEHFSEVRFGEDSGNAMKRRREAFEGMPAGPVRDLFHAGLEGSEDNFDVEIRRQTAPEPRQNHEDGDGDTILERLRRIMGEENHGNEEPNLEVLGYPLSPEDTEVVRRLRRGTPLDLPTVAQVYIACDRDESLTEACLLSMLDGG